MPILKKGAQGSVHAQNVGASTDARTGLGYGTFPKYHVPKTAGDSFPYVDPDKYADILDDIDLDVETQDRVGQKANMHYLATDPFAGNGTDPFYFAAGNTKLSDCFFRTDHVLKEVIATGKSLSPVPDLHSSRARHDSMTRSAGAGGSTPRISSMKRTGTERGYSHAPPRPKVTGDDVVVDIMSAIDNIPLDFDRENNLAVLRAKVIEKIFKNRH